MRYVEVKTNKEYQDQLNNFIVMDYTTKEQTTTSSRLIKRKKISVGLCILWFILGIFPLVIYLIYCVARKPQDDVMLVLKADD